MSSISQRTSLFLTVIALTFIVAGPGHSETSLQVAPMNPKYLEIDDQPNGYLPMPMDLSHIKAPVQPMGPMAPEPLPLIWDWRANGGTTPVDDQNPWGTCWAFASIADFESTILIGSGVTWDLSESQLVGCNYPYSGRDCDNGGNPLISTSVLTVMPSQTEACDPYDCPDLSCDTYCPGTAYVTGWQMVPNDETSLKNAVYDYGPVQAGMYSGFPGFNTYDGTYMLYYDGPEPPNHYVTIVGWDDTYPHAGGTGGWIVKNSWGTWWGDEGYFYIAYGSAQMGINSSVYTAYKDYDPDEIIMYYDNRGMYQMLGYGIDTAWGAARYTPPQSGNLTHVDFWAVATGATFDIYVYDDFDGSTLSNLLDSQLGGSVLQAGYHSIQLVAPIPVTAGDEITIVMKITTPGYNWPIPVAADEPIETDKSYLSSNGVGWLYVGAGSAYNKDIGIRGRMTAQANSNYTPPDPLKTYYGDANGDQLLMTDDVGIHKDYASTNYSAGYNTTQPTAPTKYWNTCDLNGDNLCMGDDISNIKQAAAGRPLTQFPPWSWEITNVDLPVSVTAGEWTPFSFSVRADIDGMGTYAGRPGLNIKTTIAPDSPGTGTLVGRTCNPNPVGHRDQYNTDDYSCAVGVSITDWASDPTAAPTQSGSFGVKVRGDGNGDLRIVGEIQALPILGIPAEIAVADVDYYAVISG